MSMLFMDDPYGYSIGLTKPVELGSMPLPKIDTLQNNPGESLEAYKWIVNKINYLFKAFKFTPGPINLKYLNQNIPESEETKYGICITNPNEAAEACTDGVGTPFGTHHGINTELFGYTHGIGNKYLLWGAGEDWGGKTINATPSAGDEIVLKGIKESLFDVSDYDDPGKFKDVMGLDNPFGDYNGYISDAQSFLNSLNGKSYYDIAMDGINDTKFIVVNDTDTDDDGWKPGSQWIKYDETLTSWGKSVTDTFIPEQWFLLMTSIVRDRRAIFGTMAELFGSPSLIYNNGDPGPNDQAIIELFKGWMDDPKKGGGVSPSNLAALDTMLKLQHYFHGFAAAYSGGKGYDYKYNGPNSAPDLGDKGANGLVRSLRDGVTFKRFRQLIHDNVYKNSNSYLSTLKGAEYENAKKLYDEFRYEYPLPYGGVADHPKYIGWDFYCDSFDKANKPENINPKATGHKHYLVSQVMNLTSSQIEGSKLVDGKNLHEKNWGLNVLGTFSAKERLAQTSVMNVIFMNFNNRSSYQIRKQDFDRKKEEIEDKIYDEKRADAKAQAKAFAKRKAEIKRSENIAAQKSKNSVKGLNKAEDKKHSPKNKPAPQQKQKPAPSQPKARPNKPVK